MNRHLLYPACLLGGIFLTALGIGAVRLLNRAVDRYLRSHFERAGVAYLPDRSNVTRLDGRKGNATVVRIDSKRTGGAA